MNRVVGRGGRENRKMFFDRGGKQKVDLEIQQPSRGSVPLVQSWVDPPSSPTSILWFASVLKK